MQPCTNNEFYAEVIQQIKSIPNDNRIIGGSYNLVLGLENDKKSGKMTTNKKSHTLINNCGPFY